MSALKAFTPLALALLLGGCASLFEPDLTDKLEVKRTAWEHTQAGCQGSDCPLVNIDTVSFADEPQLNALIDQRLRQMTANAPGATVPATLQGYEKEFLQVAEPGWSSYLQAKVREQHDGLVIIELSSYLFTGGAHGMPARQLINFDRKLHKVLTLQDILIPGQEAAFWQAAELAHKSWLIANKLDQDPEFIKNWPFIRTNNIGLTFGAVSLMYDVYSIAPYASGHPELKIPYPRLNGIVKPQYFPGRGK
ncbi:MAG: RsiV family protein [Pseudomonas sp.]|uniref:RsiV family protein n=1 Tax=Pseudomonas sp. TaxID=306 RepID=UPI0030F33C22